MRTKNGCRRRAASLAAGLFPLACRSLESHVVGAVANRGVAGPRVHLLVVAVWILLVTFAKPTSVRYCKNCRQRTVHPSWRPYCSRRCHMRGQLDRRRARQARKSRRYAGRTPMDRGGQAPPLGQGWPALAAAVRDRDGHCCRRCGLSETANGQDLSVDHIVPRRCFTVASEADCAGNLAALCRSCHGWKTADAERRLLHGDVISFAQYRRSLRLTERGA